MKKEILVLILLLLLVGCTDETSSTGTGDASTVGTQTDRTADLSSTFSVVENGELPSIFEQSFACIDSFNGELYELALSSDKKASAINIEDGNYSVSDNKFHLTLPFNYGSTYQHTGHSLLNNTMMGYFSGTVGQGYQLYCIAYKHNLGDKTTTPVTINCVNRSSSTDGTFTETTTKRFILQADGSSSYEFFNDVYSGGTSGTLSTNASSTDYGTYIYLQSTGEFSLNYMSIDVQNQTTSINTFDGVLTNSGASIPAANGDSGCTLE